MPDEREAPERRRPLGDPRPRAVAVVVRGHKLLVIARVLDGRAYAVLPGGGIEPGETAAEAAVRELAEECSLTGTVVRQLLDGGHGGRSASYFLVDAPDGEPVLGGEEAVADGPDNSYQPLWVTAGELGPIGLLPEGIADELIEAAWPLRVSEAGPGEWQLIERLWQLYQHDLSEFRHGAPGPDGLFAPGRLPAYAETDGRIGYLARLGDVPCGFALVRRAGRRPTHGMGEFFVTRSARGRGVARRFATHVVADLPGRWEIPFQEENPRAAAFWRRFAGDVLDEVSERTVGVPGKVHLPPDVWLSGTSGVDWVAWHEPYADPMSSLSRRLAVIQRHLERVLDESSPESLRILSICSGDGRDLIEVLAGRKDEARVSAVLLELDPRNVERAHAATTAAGLTGIDMRVADAGDPASYDGLGPADIVLMAGVFGNVPDTDVRRTVARVPALCTTGATVIWTRHRNEPDLTPDLRGWCAEAGFVEVAFEAPDDTRYAVGVHRWPGPDGDGVLGEERLFTFFR